MVDTITNGSQSAGQPRRILVINPNRNTGMTETIKTAISTCDFSHIQCDYFTCSGPGGALITEQDIQQSTEQCMDKILPIMPQYEAFLVACYSRHPLVPLLQRHCAQSSGRRVQHVTGIFESSVLQCLALMPITGAFGIVSTTHNYVKELDDAVAEMLGAGEIKSKRFLGCVTIGVQAEQIDSCPAAEMQKLIEQAVVELQSRSSETSELKAIVLGCAGMTILDEVVRIALKRQVDISALHDVFIVDGLKAGIGMLVNLLGTTSKLSN